MRSPRKTRILIKIMQIAVKNNGRRIILTSNQIKSNHSAGSLDTYTSAINNVLLTNTKVNTNSNGISHQLVSHFNAIPLQLPEICVPTIHPANRIPAVLTVV